MARAASTGGGRATARRNTPWSWWMSIVAIAVVGTVLVGYSRQERLHPASTADKTPPTLTDTWNVALAFDICGHLEPALPANPPSTTIGIKTTGNGVVRIQPLTSADTGHHATLGRFVAHYPGLALTAASLRYPGQGLHRNGQTCDGRPARVQVKTWATPTSATGHVLSGDPGGLRLENGQLITVAFVPLHAIIPKPSGQVITALFTAMNSAIQKSSTTTTSAATVTVPPSTATTATTGAPGATTSTTAGQTTTTKP